MYCPFQYSLHISLSINVCVSVQNLLLSVLLPRPLGIRASDRKAGPGSAADGDDPPRSRIARTSDGTPDPVAGVQTATGDRVRAHQLVCKSNNKRLQQHLYTAAITSGHSDIRTAKRWFNN